MGSRRRHLTKPFIAGAVVATDSLVSQELKTLHEELSASQKERAASRLAGAAPASMVGPTTEAPEQNELHDQLRQFADGLKRFFDGADTTISAHHTRSVVGALLVGILIGRLLGRR
jgi:ElaB/YqjD/DUF883 family membrane-anchored ribosome-binding protein